ncbi:MAG: hypothetical protein OXI91_02095 [Chloroflexota bacterium]|nr:hypothetical protein [Chloroflexota bacterium]
MADLETTDYFELRAKFKHPEVAEEWVIRVLANPWHTETQPDGRIRYYGYIKEADKWIRVIFEDGKLFNRFIDGRALKRWVRPQ